MGWLRVYDQNNAADGALPYVLRAMKQGFFRNGLLDGRTSPDSEDQLTPMYEVGKSLDEARNVYENVLQVGVFERGMLMWGARAVLYGGTDPRKLRRLGSACGAPIKDIKRVLTVNFGAFSPNAEGVNTVKGLSVAANFVDGTLYEGVCDNEAQHRERNEDLMPIAAGGCIPNNFGEPSTMRFFSPGTTYAFLSQALFDGQHLAEYHGNFIVRYGGSSDQQLRGVYFAANGKMQHLMGGDEVVDTLYTKGDDLVGD